MFLQIKSRGKSPRKYFNYFKDLKSDFPNLKEIKVCPFQNNHQCLRNTAFARALKDQNGLKQCYHGLIYHDSNKRIEQAWKSYYELVSQEVRKESFAIKASEIIRKSTNENLKNYFKERYLIDGYIKAL